MICYEPDIDKIYLCAKDFHGAKYQFLVNKRESTSLKSIWMFLKLLLDTGMIWMIVIEILKNTIQVKNVKY